MDQNVSEGEKPIWRGEIALALAVVINSFGVVLMLYSGSGISAISSVPFAFSEVFSNVSLGTWTYIFQGLLVITLMLLRKHFVPQYLFSFVVGFIFSELLDVHELWIDILLRSLFWSVLYFIISYFPAGTRTNHPHLISENQHCILLDLPGHYCRDDPDLSRTVGRVRDRDHFSGIYDGKSRGYSIPFLFRVNGQTKLN